MISLDRVAVQGRTTSGANLLVSGVTVDLGPGRWALLGGGGDGADLLLAGLAGEVRLRHGRVRYFGRSDGAAGVARDIAYVSRDGLLPFGLNVLEVLTLSARLRGEPPRPSSAEERLHAWGLQSLARRPVRGLSLRERRAVSLAEALTSEAKVILIDEPLCDLDDRIVAAVPDALRRRAQAGDCVVFATSSMTDALALADDALILQAGQLVARLDLRDPTQLRALLSPTMEVRTAQARLLLAELALEPEVIAIDTSASDPSPRGVTVRGLSLERLAEAVQRAIVRAEVSVSAIISAPPTLDEVQRAAHAQK